MYRGKRYFVTTGERVPGTEPAIEERTVALAAVYTAAFGATNGNGEDDGAPPPNVKPLLKLHAGGELPAGKLEDLMKAVPYVSQLWQRQVPQFVRPDGTPDPSKYDQALANQAAKAGWPPQEIFNLCIAWRKKWGEALHLDNPSKWHGTISKALVAFGPKPPSDESDDHTLTAAFGVPKPKRLEKRLCDPPYYTIVLDDDARVGIGDVDDLYSPKCWDNAFTVQLNRTIPFGGQNRSTESKGVVTALLKRQVEIPADPLETRRGYVLEYARRYLSGGLKWDDRIHDWAYTDSYPANLDTGHPATVVQAVHVGRRLILGGKKAMNLGGFERWMIDQFGGKVVHFDINRGRVLAEEGFTRLEVERHHQGKSARKHYWVPPDGWLTDGDDEAKHQSKTAPTASTMKPWVKE
jgi:hypothetical protein